MASGEVAMLFEALPDQETPERLGGGAPRLRYAERGQIEWRPFSLDQLVPEDHRVRLVWRFVEGLDLTPLLAAIKAVEGHAGHAPADPRILMALWLYATVKGIGSAREVSRLCEEHLAFQWLCGGVSMNAKSLSDFRVNHGDVLEQLLADSFTALVQAGLASLERVAQDGMRVRAAAGAASFRRHSTLQECRREAQQAIADLRAQLAADPGSATRQQAAARQRAAAEREQRVRAALAVTAELHAQQQEQARLEAERAAAQAQQDAAKAAKKTKTTDAEKTPAEPRASTTDAEARTMKMADGGFRPAYNVQFAADTESTAIAGVSVDNSGTLIAQYSNGQTKAAGQLELANFRNPQGLTALGGNAWKQTAASGGPTVGVAGDGNLGVLNSGSLEESNVDLTAELVSMITAQRDYQANAQTIKTMDQAMQTLANLR